MCKYGWVTLTRYFGVWPTQLIMVATWFVWRYYSGVYTNAGRVPTMIVLCTRWWLTFFRGCLVVRTRISRTVSRVRLKFGYPSAHARVSRLLFSHLVLLLPLQASPPLHGTRANLCTIALSRNLVICVRCLVTNI